MPQIFASLIFLSLVGWCGHSFNVKCAAKKRERKIFCSGKTVAGIGGCSPTGCAVLLASGEKTVMYQPGKGEQCK